LAFQRKKTEAVGVKAPLPGFIEPALASSIAKVPSGGRWVHEIKFDGYRVQVQLANEAVRIFTRRGHDWTHRFKKVADDAWHIKAATAVIDGEVVVLAADGSTDFAALQNELKGSSKSIVLVAFDLLYLNGRDVRKLPLFRLKNELKKVVAGTDIQFSENFEIDGEAMFAHACKLGLEGVVSKVRNSAYPTGRSNDWVKKTLRAAGDADHRRVRARRRQVGRHLSRPTQGQGSRLCRQGRPWLRQDIRGRLAETSEAFDPRDATVREADRAQGHLGRTETARRDRIPGEVGGGQSPASVLQGAARRYLMMARGIKGTDHERRLSPEGMQGMQILEGAVRQ
jgi:hypothetical protein